jgi:hypothetical protein
MKRVMNEVDSEGVSAKKRVAQMVRSRAAQGYLGFIREYMKREWPETQRVQVDARLKHDADSLLEKIMALAEERK